MKKSIDIAFCVDDAFTIHLAALIYGVGEYLSKEYSVKCHVIGVINENNKKKISSLSSQNINMYFYEKIPDYSHIPISSVYQNRLNMVTYCRFSIPDILFFIDKVLYIDVDVIAVDDISKLWEVDLNGSIVGVVSDHILGSDVVKQKKLGITSGNYFNAGLMLIDLAKWRNNNISEKALEQLSINSGFEHNDQDALNIVLEEAVTYLDLRWNTQPNDLAKGKIKNPALVHFCGQEKPWHVSSVHPFTQQYLSYRKMTPYSDEPLECFLDDDDRLILQQLAFVLPLGGRVAVWGAGQRGRRICFYLKNIMTTYQLEYIIDKNLQGSYLGVEILSSISKSEYIDALVIASIPYRDEIMSEIKKQITAEMHII